LAVQGTEHGVLLVVELFCEEDALVASEGHRLWERSLPPSPSHRGGVIDVVHRSPRTVYPVGTSLEDVVLEIVLVEKEYLPVGMPLVSVAVFASAFQVIMLDSVCTHAPVPTQSSRASMVSTLARRERARRPALVL
jgi:hypothetical protein